MVAEFPQKDDAATTGPDHSAQAFQPAGKRRFSFRRGLNAILGLALLVVFVLQLPVDPAAAGQPAGYPGRNEEPKTKPLVTTAFSYAGNLTLSSYKNIGAGAIDTANGFAYFGAETNPGVILKLRLSDFTLVDVLSLNSGEQDINSAVLASVNGYAYFGTNTAPGRVIKVRLSDLSRVAALPLSSGENNLRSAVIDPLGHYAYFGASTDPGKVVCIHIGAFAGNYLYLSAILR